MHENNPNHHFLPHKVELMHLARNYSHNFGTPKYCIQVRNTGFASFYMQKVNEVLQNTLQHNFWSNGVEWMDGFVVKSFSQLQYPEIVHSGPKYKFPSNFQFRRIPKSSKTFTNIIIAPRIGGCIWWEIIFTTSVPQNSAFKSETQVSNQFTISKVSEILQNTHKHHYWYERLE
jgi:hypothetical protein